MTKPEFITQCVKRGICTKKEAAEYAGDQDTFTEADFERVFRRCEKITSDSDKWHHIYGGFKTTKSYEPTED